MTKKKNGTLRPFTVGRTDGGKLTTGSKKRRYKTHELASTFATLEPAGIQYFVHGPDMEFTLTMKLPTKIVEDGIYIDVPSASRDDLVHHVYTGDAINSPMCTCEAYHHGTIEPNVLYTCTHIRRVVYGEEK